VIEIASLKEIEDYKLNFIQVVAERMASELLNIQSKVLTGKLAEDFKKQAEEMSNHEKELIKQIEVLESETRALKSSDSSKEETLRFYNDHVTRIDFDDEGKLLYSNRSTSELKEIIQTSKPVLNDFMNENETMNKFIERLTELKEISFFNKEKSEIRTFYGLFNDNNKIEKIVLVLVTLSNIDQQIAE